MLDVVRELDYECCIPPLARLTDETRAEQDQPDEHDDGVSVVDRFALHQPREEVTERSLAAGRSIPRAQIWKA